MSLVLGRYVIYTALYGSKYKEVTYMTNSTLQLLERLSRQLVDEHLYLTDYTSRRRVLLGLQMGLELGALAALPQEDFWQYAQFF